MFNLSVTGGPTESQRDAQGAQREPKGSQNRPKENRTEPLRSAKGAQSWAEGDPREPKGGPRDPKDNQRHSQESQQERKTIPRSDQKTMYSEFACFLRIQRITAVKSMIPKVGGSIARGGRIEDAWRRFTGAPSLEVCT